MGVLVYEKSKFDSYAAIAASSANQTLGTIKRTISFLFDLNLKLTWHLHPLFTKKDKFILETVQRRATKLICKFQTVPYCECLCYLTLPSLTYRCKNGDVITAFKLILTNIVPDLFLFAITSSTEYHSKKLSKMSCRLHQRNQFFSNRVTSLWNRLSEYAVSELVLTLSNQEWMLNRVMLSGNMIGKALCLQLVSNSSWSLQGGNP